MALAVGTLCYVDYGEHPACIHTRLVIEHIEADDYIIGTPDHDVYCETLHPTNPDYVNFVVGGAGGAVPAGINPAHVYAFQPMTAQEYTALLTQGRVEAGLERARRGAGIPAPLPGPVPLAPAAPVARVWVLAEMIEGHKIGERVQPPVGHAVSGDWGLMDITDKDNITRPALIHHLPEGDIPSFCDNRVRVARLTECCEGDDRVAGEDVRTLAVKYGMGGERLRSFRESTQEMVMVEFEDFPLNPRTTLEYCKAISSISESATAQHHMWMGGAKLPEGDRSSYEDEVLARVIDLALTYDYLNISNLASMELVVRRRQLIAEAHASSPGAPSYLGAEHFMGQTYKAGGGVVVPTLTDFVSQKMQAQSAILKEKRKLAEAKSEGKGKKGNPKASPKGGGASSS